MTSYNFNVQPESTITTSPNNMLVRSTSDKIMPICVNVTGSTAVTPETLGDKINSYNAWMLSSDGKIHYVINS